MAVSFVDPMQIEIAAGFFLLRGCELAPVLGLTMGKTVAVGAQIVLPFFDALAGDSKVDQFSHAAPMVTGYTDCQIQLRTLASPLNAPTQDPLLQIWQAAP